MSSETGLGDEPGTLERLMELARRGDWSTFEEVLPQLTGRETPTARQEIEDYLRGLKELLVTAKASRSAAATSLIRLSAAAGFHERFP